MTVTKEEASIFIKELEVAGELKWEDLRGEIVTLPSRSPRYEMVLRDTYVFLIVDGIAGGRFSTPEEAVADYLEHKIDD